MFREKIVSLFLSKVNVNCFARIVEGNPFLGLPYKFFSQRLIDFDFPRHIFLESTNACNQSCEMCPRQTKPREAGFMDFNLFKKIVDEAACYGPRSFCLHIFGEPLLAPRIIDMIEYIKQVNKQNTVLFTTNGVLLNKNLSRQFIDLKVDKVRVSLNAADEKTYRLITHTDHLRSAEENVLGLISLKKSMRKTKPSVYVRMLINELTHSQGHAFRKKWQNSGAFLDIKEAHNFGGKIKEHPFLKKIYPRYPCYHLWLSPGISWDGEVSICCCDWAREAVIGNVNQDSLSGIWNGDLLKKYRTQHLKGQYDLMPLCSKCNVWTTYPDIFFKCQKH